ncbi:unnamed protein product [Musa textilis]
MSWGADVKKGDTCWWSISIARTPPSVNGCKRGKVWVAGSFAWRADQALECDPTMHESSFAGRSDRPKHGTHQLPRSRHHPGKNSLSSVHVVGPTI